MSRTKNVQSFFDISFNYISINSSASHNYWGRFSLSDLQTTSKAIDKEPRITEK